MARRIFRESALRRYNERLEKVELPRFATLRWTWVGWAGAAILLLFSALLLGIRLPVYADGPGVVIMPNPRAGLAPPGAAVIIALFPAEFANDLEVGQPASTHLPVFAGDDEHVIRVDAVEPEPISPAAARAIYNLEASGIVIEEPVVVARLTLDNPDKLWFGSAVDVRVRVGSRSGLSLVPGIGRLFAPSEG